jgi:UDP-2-acetamido-3-amino-2,3-dideoxy-glucuronate N-acetyltransferase
LIHSTAEVHHSVNVPNSANIWHLAQVREGATIGENVVLGRGVYVGAGVEIGENTKIQNYALIYDPAKLGRGVFIGPSVVLTNDKSPRAVNESGERKAEKDWVAVGVTIDDGAAIGSNSVCIAPVTIGKWAMIGAGSVVTRDVAPYALVVGNPARQIGWVGESGTRLERDSLQHDLYLCPLTDSRYILTHGFLKREEP